MSEAVDPTPAEPQEPNFKTPDAPVKTLELRTGPDGLPVEDNKEPAWLPERLARAKSSAAEELLKTAGFGSVDEIKAAREELQKLKDAQLSEQERAQKERDELMTKASRASELESTISSYAARELSGLDDAQSQAVKAIAGEDPARILAAIETLKPTWAKEAAATPAAPPPAAPATTAQTGGPPAAGNQSPVDYKAEFQRLKSSNPYLASQYYAAHAAQIAAQS